MRSSERRSGMPHLADWFSARLSSKESIDLQCLHDHRNSWSPGQMFNSFSKEVALIAVSIAKCGSLYQGLSSAQEAFSRVRF
jgi:hypothetical protein